VESGTVVRGEGFVVEVPRGATVGRPRGAVVARDSGDLVSVTRFSLRKPYDPGQFAAVAKTLDSVADRLAKATGTTVDKAETVTVSGRKTRAYEYGGRRIAFVLDGQSEYQLFCTHTGTACDLLFSSFQLS
jgi:hypothetical protein